MTRFSQGSHLQVLLGAGTAKALCQDSVLTSETILWLAWDFRLAMKPTCMHVILRGVPQEVRLWAGDRAVDDSPHRHHALSGSPQDQLPGTLAARRLAQPQWLNSGLAGRPLRRQTTPRSCI